MSANTASALPLCVRQCSVSTALVVAEKMFSFSVAVSRFLLLLKQWCNVTRYCNMIGPHCIVWWDMACLCGLPDPFAEVGLACRTRSIQWLICSKEGVAPVLICYKDCTCIILQHHCSWACMLKTLTIILACGVIIIFVWFLDYFWSIPYHILYSNNVHMYIVLWRYLDKCFSRHLLCWQFDSEQD